MVEITREELNDIVTLAISELYEQLILIQDIRRYKVEDAEESGETYEGDFIDRHIQELYDKINKLEAVRRDGFKLVEESSDD